MGWEKRGNREYYYRKERDGSRVKSVYVGRGEIAQAISEIQSRTLMLERVARISKSPQKVHLEREEAMLEQLTDTIQLITQAALLANGFHTHHRQWRRKRNAGRS